MKLESFFEAHSIEYKEKVDTKKLSSIKAGGIADLIVFPKDLNEFCLCALYFESECLHYRVMGAFSNTAFSDSGYKGAIISTKRMNGFSFENGYISLGAGCLFSLLSRRLARDGIDLCCPMSGIPGSVGGMIMSNAGAYGYSISDIFVKGVFFDKKCGRNIEISKNELKFSYRYCGGRENDLLFLRGDFIYNNSSSEELALRIRSFSEKRKNSQPSQPSLGSFFKRYRDIPVSALIDKAGLKGTKFGGAEVSAKHAGFIVNTGNATVEDIDTLAKFVENKIFSLYGLKIEREAELIFDS